MDWTTRPNRIQRLAGLLGEACAEPPDLPANEELMEDARQALAVPLSDHPLECELRDLLSRCIHAPGTVDSYAVDRAIAEAEGVVGPGGAIEYQYRWQSHAGEWSEWRTWRTRTTMDEPVPDPMDAQTIQFGVAPAQS